MGRASPLHTDIEEEGGTEAVSRKKTCLRGSAREEIALSLLESEGAGQPYRE